VSSSLEDVAKRINWYMEPRRLLANVDLFLCQVMARGSKDDIVAVRRQYTDDDFRKAYRNAPAGLFSKRAWAYWGLMLIDNADLELPERFAGANRLDWRKST
jgi:hypothetical protein